MKKKRKTEKELEQEAIIEEEMSFLSMILIVGFCVVVGVIVGYILYKVALNNSSPHMAYAFDSLIKK